MKVFFADTETTGLDPRKNEAFQLAFILVVDGKVVEERDLKMRPERWKHVTEEALKVTGKTVEELKTYPSKRETYDKLILILSKHVDRYDRNDKMIWVGQNPRFDVDFVDAWFREMGDVYFGSWWDRRPADLTSLAVAAKMRGILNPPNFKLQTICEAIGVPLKPHDALDDVRATRAAFRHFAGLMKPEKTTV